MTGFVRAVLPRFIGFAAVALAQACSDPNGTTLPAFHDLPSAPTPIQQAAKAVVRVRTAREAATGVFVSSSGLLLTNNHVLGDMVCPIEGCFVELTFGRQVGTPRQDPVNFFAVPVAVDVGLDMALVQILMGPGGSPLATTNFVPIVSLDSPSLVGDHVTVVGHPEGYLKKWTDGVVAEAEGDWFKATAFTLPGDSGSPVLDDAGELVGIIHRGPTSEDLISATGVNVYSIGTASAPLLSAMSAPLPAAMISVTAPASASDVVARDLLFANARTSQVTVDGQLTSVLSLLGQACDAGLARQDVQSPDDLSAALRPCDHATTLIDCRSDTSATPYQVQCPSPTDVAAWAARFQAMNQRWLAMNGQMALTPISFGIAHLQATTEAGKIEGQLSLQAALADVQPPLDFELATYLAAFRFSSLDGASIKDYVKGYRSELHYELQATYVAYAAGWLFGNGFLTREEAISILENLRGDPTVSLGTKLYVDDSLYDAGKL